ncbi:MAG: heme-binding protein [Myxococcota bacterium]|nr:heme-binding protein [Myxococcota bacterium]
MNDALLWIGVGTALVAGLWSGYTVFYEGQLEQPAYETVLRQSVFEVRRYEPFIVATTPIRGQGRAQMSDGFRSLAGYIFGRNQPREKLAMTAPVLATTGEALGMTAPVITDRSAGHMAFVMPSQRTLADLPRPTGRGITLKTTDWGLVAAVRYAGYATEERVQRQTKSLNEWLTKQGYEVRGEALSAQYNSPSAMPLLRRNEILIPVRPVVTVLSSSASEAE